jgi:hypothetical protein
VERGRVEEEPKRALGGSARELVQGRGVVAVELVRRRDGVERLEGDAETAEPRVTCPEELVAERAAGAAVEEPGQGSGRSMRREAALDRVVDRLAKAPAHREGRSFDRDEEPALRGELTAEPRALSGFDEPDAAVLPAAVGPARRIAAARSLVVVAADFHHKVASFAHGPARLTTFARDWPTFRRTGCGGRAVRAGAER